MPMFEPSDGDWVTVARIGGLNARMEAEMLQSVLAGHGFSVRLYNDNAAGWMPMYSLLIPVRVAVLAEEADAVRDVLAREGLGQDDGAALSASRDDAAVVDYDDQHEFVQGADEVHCPECGSLRIERGQASLLFGLMSVVLLGIPLLLRWSSWSCPDCGWRGSSSDIF